MSNIQEQNHRVTTKGNGSASTVKRHCKELGLPVSGATTKHLPRNEKEQLVLDAMDHDPAGHQGVCAIQQNIKAWPNVKEDQPFPQSTTWDT